MVSTVRLFVDASYAIAIMASRWHRLGFRNGRGSRATPSVACRLALAMFALTGAVLTVRLWRVTRRGDLPQAEVAPPEAQDSLAAAGISRARITEMLP